MSGNLKSLNQLINTTTMGSGNSQGSGGGDGGLEVAGQKRLYLNIICPFTSVPVGKV